MLLKGIMMIGKLCIQCSVVLCGLCVVLIFFTGCTSDTVYLQDLNVIGPIKQPPIHITEKHRERGFSISPWFSLHNQEVFAGQIAGHSKVSASDVFVVDTIRQNGNIVGFEEPQGVNIIPYQGKTMHWAIPTSTYGVDINFTSSSLFALSLGLSYGMTRQEGFWGGDFGIGFMFDGDIVAGRLDGGIQWQTLSYTASSIVVQTTSFLSGVTQNRVAFFEDRGRITPVTFWGSFTLNTTMEVPVNYVMQVAVSKQQVVDFQPTHLSYVNPYFQFGSHDARVQNSTTFFIVTPGAYVKLTDASRILFGGRFIFETEIKNSHPNLMFMPIVKIDWKL